jgi:hypothetical protein
MRHSAVSKTTIIPTGCETKESSEGFHYFREEWLGLTE